MALNFALHARYLLERPANHLLLAAASAVDLIMITAVVLVWPGANGLESEFFVYYFPVVAAFAFVFRPRRAAAYTGGALAAYAAACLIADPSFVLRAGDLKLLVVRVIALASIGGLAAYYWRTQREQRRASAPSWSRPAVHLEGPPQDPRPPAGSRSADDRHRSQEGAGVASAGTFGLEGV
jgi:hypothetical protein